MGDIKKFKMKIRVKAERFEGDDGTMTFSDVADAWYNTIGKESLESYFKKIGPVTDKSFLQNFSFGDTVDKEAYD